MSEQPTREQLDDAVSDCSGPLHVVHSQGLDTVRRHAIVLAAEVLRLRARLGGMSELCDEAARNCKRFREAHEAAERRLVELRELLGQVEQASEQRIAELRALDARVQSMGAAFARVEALPALWRERCERAGEQRCAAELEATLRGEL